MGNGAILCEQMVDCACQDVGILDRERILEMNSACKPLRSADQMTGLAMNELEAAAEARIKELEAVLREYIDAADQCLSGADDIANMLRFGAADKAAREALR